MVSHEFNLSLEPGRSMKERLELANPLLHPAELKTWIPEFGNFRPLPNDSEQILWFNMRTAEKLAGLGGSAKTFFWLYSGLTAGGKDAIRKMLAALHPDIMTKPLSATTRKPRKKDNERHGIDYLFYTKPQFEKMIERNEFIEYAFQYGDIYGMPKTSLDEAVIKSSEVNRPIIMAQLEVGAWHTIYQHLIKYYQIPAFSTFILPQMPYSEYTQKWLPEKRPDDYLERAKRSSFELILASRLADIVVINPMNPENPGAEACTAIEQFLYGLFPNPITLNPMILQDCQPC